MPASIKFNNINITLLNKAISEYFIKEPTINKILAKELMPLFLKKNLFKKNTHDGYEIRQLLRDLSASNELYKIPSAYVKQNDKNRNWYFVRTNFKGEQFTEIPSDLNLTLKKISDTLLHQLKTDESYNVKEIIDLMKKGTSFNELWKCVPNNTRNKHAKDEYKGLYVFSEVKGNELKPVYMGISQTIKRRFKDHTLKKDKHHATWAYFMGKYNYSIKRYGEYRKNLTIRKQDELDFIIKNQKYIHSLRFTFICLDDNFMLHMAEAFCTISLKTYWNTFETH